MLLKLNLILLKIFENGFEFIAIYLSHLNLRWNKQDML